MFSGCAGVFGEHLLSVFRLCRCIHLSNNSIQKHYRNGERAEELPDDNMWHCDEFKEYLRSVLLASDHFGYSKKVKTKVFELYSTST